MIKNIFATIIFLSAGINIFSQVESKDSIYAGRVCIIILNNGFESSGIITNIRQDTIVFSNEFTEYSIPVKDIKLILNPDNGINNQKPLYDNLDLKLNGQRLLTKECDVYLGSGTLLKDVKLVSTTDSSVLALKNTNSRSVNTSEIRKIVFKPTAPFGYGFLIGGAVGFASAFLPVAFAKGGGHPDLSGPGFGFLFGLIIAVPAGLIGGVTGLLLAADDVYYFDKGYSVVKNKRIKYVMKKHSM